MNINMLELVYQENGETEFKKTGAFILKNTEKRLIRNFIKNENKRTRKSHFVIDYDGSDFLYRAFTEFVRLNESEFGMVSVYFKK